MPNVNCVTDADCPDKCNRYKCDTGIGECYLPWGSEPCGSVVRGGGVGRGYRKLTNRKNINNMRRVRTIRGYGGRPTSGLSPIRGIRGGLRGSNRGRARRGRAPVNKPYVVQQMVNRGISLALATQFANKISSWWNRGGYRGVTSKNKTEFFGRRKFTARSLTFLTNKICERMDNPLHYSIRL